MPTKRELIMVALKVKLDTIAGLPCFRSRVDAFGRSSSPVVLLEPVKESADNATLQKLDWELSFTASIIVRGNVPDQVADSFISQVHSKIMEDRTLGDLALDILPQSIDYNFSPGDQTIGEISIGYRLNYRTNVNDLTA